MNTTNTTKNITLLEEEHFPFHAIEGMISTYATQGMDASYIRAKLLGTFGMDVVDNWAAGRYGDTIVDAIQRVAMQAKFEDGWKAALEFVKDALFLSITNLPSNASAVQIGRAINATLAAATCPNIVEVESSRTPAYETLD
jgi:hypothetical protein